VTIVNPTALSVINLFFWVLLLAAFVVETWAFGDALRRPAASFPAAGKQTKPIWMLILGVAFVIGIGGAVGYLALLSIFPIVAFVAASIYLVDVRPKIKSLKPGSNQRMGPYGPW
jgi:predicted membrane metal-binding protein